MKKIFIFPLMFLVLLSCSKPGNNNGNSIADKTLLLTGGIWHLTGYSYRNAVSTVTFADLPACRKDDLTIYHADGTGEFDEGPSKCNSASPQVNPFTWRFTNNNANHIIVGGVEYIVTKLTNTSFNISSANLDPYAPETSYQYSR